MINDCTFIGRLTYDPEIKTTPKGSVYTRFCIAVEKPNKDKDGNKSSDFIDCVAWGKKAESITSYVKKGNLVGINGRLETSTYEKNGEKRKSFDILVVTIDFIGKVESKAQENDTEPPREQISMEETVEDPVSLPFEV